QKKYEESLEWIPYDQLEKITYIANKDSGTLYKAIWTIGRIKEYNHQKSNWYREKKFINNSWNYISNNNDDTISEIYADLSSGIIVSLKHRHSSNINDFLNEVKCHLLSYKSASGCLLPLIGITKDPKTLEYIIVMHYSQGGSLRSNLQKICMSSWKVKLRHLAVIIAGLKGIHDLNLIHGDLHSDNIFLSNYDTFQIGDLGFTKLSKNYSSKNEELYG
ncbi:25044_t:CDS:2, partial [Gigaspora rosea]